MTDKALTPNEQVKVVQEYRKNQLASDFPELKREDFASDKEFFEALREQTIAIQNKEWEIVSLSVCIGGYNKYRAITVTEAKKEVFDTASKKGFKQTLEKSDDENEDENEIPMDVAGYAFQFSGEAVDASSRHVGDGIWAHCAQTASLNIYAMAEAMGLGNPLDGAEIASALGVHKGQGDGTPLCGGGYSGEDKGINGVVSVGQLIIDGKIGPGSVISYCTDSSPRAGLSGYHAMTIAGVNYDEEGKVVSYIVMDNNGGSDRTRIQVIGVNEDHPFNHINTNTPDGSKPFLYTNTTKWANDQIRERYDNKYEPMYDENGNLIGMNGEIFKDDDDKAKKMAEIATTNQRAREALNMEIDELANRENTLLTSTSYTKTCGGKTRANGLESQRKKYASFYDEQLKVYKKNDLEEQIKAEEIEVGKLSEEVVRIEDQLKIDNFDGRVEVCGKKENELLVAEEGISTACSDLEDREEDVANKGWIKRHRYAKRKEEFADIVGMYENMDETYADDLAQANEGIQAANTNLDNSSASLSECNASLVTLEEQNTALKTSRRNGSIDDKIENASDRLNNQEKTGEVLSDKAEALTSLGENIVALEESLSEKEEIVASKQQIVGAYQMVIDYSTLSRKEIKEKYGCSFKEFKEKVDALKEVFDPAVSVMATQVETASEVETKSVETPEVVTEELSGEQSGVYTPEERKDTEETMEKQKDEATEQLAANVELINSGEYGQDEVLVAEKVETLDDATKSVAVDSKEKTQDQIKKEAKMQAWFSSSNVKLDPALVDEMVSKYGIDVAYDLALKSLNTPIVVQQNSDGVWRNSRNCLRYFIENDVSDESIAKITGRSVEEVHGSRRVREEDKVQPIAVSGAEGLNVLKIKKTELSR